MSAIVAVRVRSLLDQLEVMREVGGRDKINLSIAVNSSPV
jgi:hypothetical protein